MFSIFARQVSIEKNMNPNFRLIWENWLNKQTDETRLDVDFFAQLFLGVDVKIYPRMSYGACFLYRLGPLGYFNKDKLGLYFGFYWGKLLTESPAAEIFELNQLKMVKIVRLDNKINDEDFQGKLLLLFDEALRIDDEKYKKKNK